MSSGAPKLNQRHTLSCRARQLRHIILMKDKRSPSPVPTRTPSRLADAIRVKSGDQHRQQLRPHRPQRNYINTTNTRYLSHGTKLLDQNHNLCGWRLYCVRVGHALWWDAGKRRGRMCMMNAPGWWPCEYWLAGVYFFRCCCGTLRVSESDAFAWKIWSLNWQIDAH